MAGRIELNTNLCKGCQYCVHFCPKKILVMGTQRSKKGYFTPQATQEGCTACAICALVCPDGAIEVSKGEA